MEFQFNVAKDKTEVMVFHGKGKGKAERVEEESWGWELGGKRIGVTSKYVYLGVEVDGKKEFGGWAQQRMRKAKRAWWGAWEMGIGGQWVTVKNGVMIWKVMVQSVLDYGTEVFGGLERWEEAEVLARKMAKAILGVRTSTSNEVVMGELGWWTMRGRRDYLRLMYWREVMARKEGLRWEVYEESRRRKDMKDSWCNYTERLMKEVGLEEDWNYKFFDEDKEVWKRKVIERIQEREQREWRERMSKKDKLRTYRKVKNELRMEQYLRETKGKRNQRRVMTMMRGGSNDLRIERGRYCDLSVEDRICLFCDSGEIEDEEHFLCRCSAWSEERDRCVSEARELARDQCSDLELLMCARERRDGGERSKRRNGWCVRVMEGVEKMSRARERLAKRLGVW